MWTSQAPRTTQSATCHSTSAKAGVGKSPIVKLLHLGMKSTTLYGRFEDYRINL